MLQENTDSLRNLVMGLFKNYRTQPKRKPKMEHVPEMEKKEYEPMEKMLVPMRKKEYEPMEEKQPKIKDLPARAMRRVKQGY